jgi:hypothetical protein
LLPQSFKKAPVVNEPGQDVFDLRYDVILIGKTHLVPDLWINSITGAAEVRDKRYCTDRQSLKDHASTEFANGWKH